MNGKAGRPPRGEGTAVMGVTVDGVRSGVRAPSSRAAEIAAAAEREGMAVSTFFRDVALAFARDPEVARAVRASSVWSKKESP